MTWRPIETAPKDGTPILVAGGTFDDDTSMGGAMQMKGVAIVSWRSCWGEEGWQGEKQAHDEYLWHKPTHWMALPEPPASGTRAEDKSPVGDSRCAQPQSRKQGDER